MKRGTLHFILKGDYFMKTFKTIMITFVVTVVLGGIGIVGYLFNGGNVTIEKRDVNHSKIVLIDGVVTESKDWQELLGYTVKVNIFDETYIGK